MAFLCLLCRQAGHKTIECPEANKPQGTVKPGPDAVFFSGNDASATGVAASNSLCARCVGLKLLDLLLYEDVLDELAGSPKFTSENVKLYRHLGPFRSVELVDTCPLCRLLFGIFPPEDADIEPESNYLLKPLRTYNRLGGSVMLRAEEADEVKKSTAAALHEAYTVSVSVTPEAMLQRMAVELLATANYRFMYYTSIGIVGRGGSGTKNSRTGLPPRRRGMLVDFEVISGWLERCEAEHPDCTPEWSEELLTTSMIDVTTLKVVDCPSGCRYAALSYIWGAIIPEPDALAKGTLPPTIVDAIEATRALGLRYLWVDALCIDQKPSPHKTYQLQIMDRIYAGAYVTLVAYYGDSSLYGLPGVSAQARPSMEGEPAARRPQPYEVIGGYGITAMYPTTSAEWEYATCKHGVRAWTLQEDRLSKRLVMFGRDQVHFRCQRANLEESVDETADPARVLDLFATREGEAVDYYRQLSKSRSSSDPSAMPSRLQRRQHAAQQLMSIISNYTTRKMSHDQDSLNACLGLISFVRRAADLQPFVWGLPLRDFPMSLLWHHNVGMSMVGEGMTRAAPARRRSGFPSWSFVGWEGEVNFMQDILPWNEKTDAVREDMEAKSIVGDMAPEFVALGGVEKTEEERKVLVLRGWTVRFAIRREPFSEAFMPDTDVNMGMISENSQRHALTLPEGVFDFVVVCRLKRAMSIDRSKHTLYLMMLDYSSAAENGGVPSRRSLVEWRVDSEFVKTPAYAASFKRRDAIQIV